VADPDSYREVDATLKAQVADPDSYREVDATLKAQVAELVDALDSKSSSARSAGSIPALGTRVSASNLQVSLKP
jgi:hypothetical protein